MTVLFELDWAGGPAEARLRRRRPGIERLPWGALAAEQLDGDALIGARRSWTEGAHSEYVSAAAFAALTTALLEAGAPVDLIAMVADCTVDEMDHVELAARMCAEVGGAAPLACDFAMIAPAVDATVSPLQRAAEIAVVTSSIGEVLSVPTITGSRKATKNPLVRAVLSRLLRDEPTHARIGGYVLDWAGDRVDRERLGALATRRLAAYAPVWAGDAGLARVLGKAIADDIVAPLAARGITVVPPPS